MKNIFSLAVVSGILNTMMGLATPFLYAALGETLTQTSGVVNLGVDGIMLLSAFASYYIALETGNLAVGVLVGIAVGLVMGVVTAFMSVTLKAEQGISGIGVYLFGGLLVGGVSLQATTGVPTDLVTTIEGLVVIFVVSIEFLRRRARAQALAEAQAARAADAGPVEAVT